MNINKEADNKQIMSQLLYYNDLDCKELTTKFYKDFMTHILPFSNQDINKFEPLGCKEYNKIIKQTVDSYNKAQAELKLEQDIRQNKEQRQLRLSGISMKL